MKNDNNDTIIEVEATSLNTEKVGKIKRKMINKTSETYKKLFLDRISGKLGEC